MDKIDKPRGLIRYATEEELKGGKTHFLRPRLVGYFTVLLIMITAFSYVLLTRTPFKLEIERGRGSLYQLTVNDTRSEEHTSELQSRPHLVCRLLLEKK